MLPINVEPHMVNYYAEQHADRVGVPLTENGLFFLQQYLTLHPGPRVRSGIPGEEVAIAIATAITLSLSELKATKK